MYKCQRSTYLAHHGIGGMKWGKRNGPPYPLNYTDLSAEEKSQAKEKAIRDGNIKEAAANRSEFSDQELKAVIDRYDLNKKLSDLNNASVKKGRDKMDDLKKNIDSAAGLSESAIKAYNIAAKVANSFGAKWTVIDGNGTKQKDAKQLTEKDLDKVLKNPNKYSNQQLADLKARMDTLGMIKDKNASNNKSDKELTSISDDNFDQYTNKQLQDYKNRVQNIETIKNPSKVNSNFNAEALSDDQLKKAYDEYKKRNDE